jgi:hypothetical protein
MNGLILLGVLAIIFGIVFRIWGEVPFLDVFCIILGCFMLLIGITHNSPTAMDVYQNKTTLEITYRNGVPVDSVVVFKDKEK